ncbi:MAG: NAD(P)H-hydrate dehydratase [Eubacteriales bacterium]|nr:NAD(P)H-hydrate dehydratase [Eubacteriales bacterium]
MTEYVTGRAAKLIDEYSIKELSIPSLKLMEKASEGVAIKIWEYANERIGVNGQKALRIIACSGVGNNGADGLCTLSILKSMGFSNLQAFYIGNVEKASEEFIFQRERLEKNEIEFSEFNGKLPDCDIIIDAVFGIGLGRSVEGRYLELIKEINRLKDEIQSYIVSVDVPSGIDADNGINMCDPFDAVKADATVTFGYAKTGHILGKGPLYTGKLKIADIGYPVISGEELLAYKNKKLNKQISGFDRDCYIYRSSDYGISEIEYKLTNRDELANKGSYKKLLIVAGSKGMAGAAYLSGLAAFKAGIGMVKYLGPEENRVILQTLLPEAMYESIEDTDFATKLKEPVKWADCITLGPGLSQSEAAYNVVKAFSDEEIKENIKGKILLIDADALNIIASHRELEAIYNEHTIITPHVGEFARLTGLSIEIIKGDPFTTSASYAHEHGISVVLKDNVSVIAINDNIHNKTELYINTEGSGALGKAGSGDVLTGAIQGLLAVISEGRDGIKDFRAHLMNTVFIFGRAGRLCADKFNEHGSLARDVAEQIPYAMKLDKNNIRRK